MSKEVPITSIDRVILRAAAAQTLHLPLQILNTHAAVAADALTPTIVEAYGLEAYATFIAIVSGYPLRNLSTRDIKVTVADDRYLLHLAGSDDKEIIEARLLRILDAYKKRKGSALAER